MTLPITTTMAAAAALLNIWLAVRCIRMRFQGRVEHGDGGNPLMLVRMRAQANYIEYAPFFLILLGLVEYARGPQQWLWLISACFFAGRIAHPIGMERPAPNALRAAGIMTTFAVLAILSAYALWMVYTSPR